MHGILKGLASERLFFQEEGGKMLGNRALVYSGRAFIQAVRGRIAPPVAFRSGRFLGAVSIPQLPSQQKLGNSGCRSLATSSFTDRVPDFSNKPPKETILQDGCDYEHWFIVVELPRENMTRDEIIDLYIKTLAQVVGSEEEARMKIYSVSTKHYYAFGCNVSEELCQKLNHVPNVSWVLPDSYIDLKSKSYGGEPFINGQAVPYDPKYHEEWVRNNARCNERRSSDRPRNSDRSRNFERRREMRQMNYQQNVSPRPPQGD
ncbi:hypothetical protein SUGI_0068090 [Cryptomeria japonica]|uniref:multiple organellar RNA editing factor 8, chloroplastic/mitochondrial n=1 Tax=Cryptomeria japonica TaxID=3369 RepID=UPI002408CF40|nr:multiple organellar RNA editing factor 8, chloroplastic/mitochondrial [Cryptomeria japonica]GLJ07487.1 hypothetical protein SUGI_0068090 [Cryptomeria japonica]